MNLILLLLSLVQANNAVIADPVQRKLFAMGSELQIEIASSEGIEKIDFFTKNASRVVLSFESKISTWKTDSVLSKFNQSSGNWFKFDSSTYQSLKQSRECSQLTNNNFHPGLGKLISIWGMRDQLKIPTERLIKSTLLQSDLGSVSFDDNEEKIRKNNKNFWFEEGGFAKGAAMDLLVKDAQKEKIEDYFLNFSGQVFSHKKRAVGIADPEKRDFSVVYFDLENESMSTSSIDVQHFKHNNKTYGHILNPHTGYPVTHNSKSVTVIHPNNLWADCLSTGLLVMSENKNEFKKWMARHSEIKVILLERTGGSLVAETSCHLKNKIRTNEKVSQVIENC